MGENSNDYSIDETENPCETTDVYVQSLQSSGSRGFRGQRSRRSRGGRLRNRGRSAGTQHDTGYIGDEYIGDSSFTAETQSYYQASHSSRGNYHNQKAKQKQCYHCGQFRHLKRECPSIFCELCGQKGHSKTKCTTKGSQQSEHSQKFSVRPPHVFSGENDKFVVQGSDVGTKTHFNRDDLTLRDITSVPDQCRVDLSCNLRSMSNGKNSALSVDAVVNGRAANSFNSETNTLEHEPIQLFPWKIRFEALSSIDLNEGNDSDVETYLTTTVASQLSSTEKVKIKRDENGLFILKRTNKPTII